MSTSKPWLEYWRVIASGIGIHIEPGDEDFGAPVMLQGARCCLAAAAPALVRALLAAEWNGMIMGDEDDNQRCPSCTRTRSRGHANSHGPCDLDAVLTAAGLPDQASRDAARGEIATMIAEGASSLSKYR